MNPGRFQFEIRDISNIREQLQPIAIKLERPNLYYDACYMIRDVFKECTHRIDPLLPSHHFIIVINLESTETDAEVVALASFDSKASSQREIHFSVYDHSIIQVIGLLVEDRNDECRSSFTSTVYHELIHGIDITSIKRVNQNRDRDLVNYKMALPHREENTQQYDSVVQWKILNFFSMFRNEGISILGENLLHDPGKYIGPPVEHFIADFKNAVGTTLKTFRGLNFHHRLNDDDAISTIDRCAHEAYSYGDELFSHMLNANREVYTDFPTTVLDFLARKSSEIPKESDILHFIDKCTEIDLMEYIQRLLTLPALDCMEEFLTCCIAMQGEDEGENSVVISSFCKHLMKAGFNRDADVFISVIRDLMGSKIPIDEMVKMHEDLYMWSNPEDAYSDIKRMVGELIDHVQKNENEVAHWALTYFFDGEDLIRDSISYLGWQDDWIVISSALRICQSPKKSNSPI